MVVKHCCYGLCTSDSRYPDRLPPETKFFPFAKPGVIKDGMTAFEKKKENMKSQRAKKWIHASGRKEFTSLSQITKDTYICSLHFIDPIEENPHPIIATSSSVGKSRKRKLRKQESVSPKILRETSPIHELRTESNFQIIPSDEYVNEVCNTKENNVLDETNVVPENEKSTQIVGLDNAIVSARLETVLLRHQFITESSKKRTNDNTMSFKSIYGNMD